MIFSKSWRLALEMAEMARLQVSLARGMPSAARRRQLLARMQQINAHVECPHDESHVLSFMVEQLTMAPTIEGVFVEAGSFKGGSTAKFSLAARAAGRKLVVFDSFEGLPPNSEAHATSILGHSISGWFEEGEFAGRLDEVKSNVARFGDIDSCEFVAGWFEDTMPLMNRPIAAAYLDVDLASSTRTCVKYLYPLLSPGGFLMSQDGDFPLVIEAMRDPQFWQDEVGWPMPLMPSLGRKKIVKISKPLDAIPIAPRARLAHPGAMSSRL